MPDNTDKIILDELINNSRITMKQLGEKVHLTGPATSSRVAKLEESGIIEGYTIKINQGKLGCYIYAFITIYTLGINHQPYLSYMETQKEFVLQHYKITGDGCFLLECRFPSNEVLDIFLEGLNKHANYKISTVINKLL